MKYGFIGLGNMASAIIRGMRSATMFCETKIYGYNRSEEKTKVLEKECGLIPCESAVRVCKAADVIVLCVKPQVMPQVLPEIKDSVKDKLIITVAAGKTIEYYLKELGDVAIVRAMPNMASKVEAGVTALCAGGIAGEKEFRIARIVFDTVGKTYDIPESQFSAFSALGGASGAFVCMYIDALAKAGVKAGLTRQLALDVAANTVLGTSVLVLKTGEHPAAITDSICSPGGTTIEGVLTLEKLGFSSAVEQGIEAIINKDKSMQ